MQPNLFDAYKTKVQALQSKLSAPDAMANPGCTAKPYFFEQGRDDVIWYNASYKAPSPETPKPSADPAKS